MTDTPKQSSTASAAAGAAIYTRQLLSVYDLAVIKVSKQLAWRCPAQLIRNFL
jgi:hypothetical protein